METPRAAKDPAAARASPMRSGYVGSEPQTDSRTHLEARPAAGSSSPSFDLAFFILSPLVGLGAVARLPPVDGNTILALAAATLIGGPHYLATYSFYFWDDTAAYQRSVGSRISWSLF